MEVVCKAAGCSYCTEGFCSNPVVCINEAGTCDHLYKFANGGAQLKPDAWDPIDVQFKKFPIIIEGAVENATDPDNVGE